MLKLKDIPILTTEQMVEVDRLMIEEFQINLFQMMENAGRNLADLARRKMGGQVTGRRIAILVGTGNNGGGGLVAARHLHNWGAEIGLGLVNGPGRIKDIPAHQLQSLLKMGIKLKERPVLINSELIIDCMIGYGLKGDPRQPVAGVIDEANKAGRPILALDTPSGLDTTSGIPGEPCIQADSTLTLALPKSGLLTNQAADYVGEIYLADISVPAELYSQLDIEVPNLFEKDPILRIN